MKQARLCWCVFFLMMLFGTGCVSAESIEEIARSIEAVARGLVELRSVEDYDVNSLLVSQENMVLGGALSISSPGSGVEPIIKALANLNARIRVIYSPERVRENVQALEGSAISEELDMFLSWIIKFLSTSTTSLFGVSDILNETGLRIKEFEGVIYSYDHFWDNPYYTRLEAQVRECQKRSGGRPQILGPSPLRRSFYEDHFFE